MSLPIGFSSQEEYDIWLAELHGAQQQLQHVADAAEKKREALLADAARGIGGGILGTALPQEVRDALAAARRIESFLPLLPDVEVPAWAAKLAAILGLVARALGV